MTDTDGDRDHPDRAWLSAELAARFDGLHKFVDRRIAELSIEVHATVQMMGFSEANLSQQLGRINEQIRALVALPVATTRNSGLELEAVVQTTESAANRIMEAAEAIGDWLREGRRDPESMETVSDKVNAIFEACTFQDLTGQRVRRAIEHLRQVENMLVEIMPAPDAASPSADPAEAANPDLHQDDVDQMFA